jgi:hypothetical protein
MIHGTIEPLDGTAEGGSGRRNDKTLQQAFKNGPVNSKDGIFASIEVLRGEYQKIMDLQFDSGNGKDRDQAWGYWGIEGFDPNYGNAPTWDDVAKFQDVDGPPASPWVPNPSSPPAPGNTREQLPAPEGYGQAPLGEGGGFVGPSINNNDPKNSSNRIAAQKLGEYITGKSSAES